VWTTTNSKHQPISFGRYIEIHETVMNQYHASGFIGNNTLEFGVLKTGVIELKGEIACLGNILITVHKTLIAPGGMSRNKSDYVQTKTYVYNAAVRNCGNILRYDNVHIHSGHSDAHHKHEYDWRRDLERKPYSPICVGIDGWPNLGEVIHEIREWYSDHAEDLPKRDSFPLLGLR
jgi:hypothetical protein